MKVTINDSATLADLSALPLKSNMLKTSPEPEILDANGKVFGPKTGFISDVTVNRMMCNKRHVQLHAELPFTVTYTIAENSPIEKLLVSTYSASATDFGYGRYEIYLSNSKESLYTPESYVSEYDRRGVFSPTDVYKGTAQIFTLDTPVTAKYFGIKFTHGCSLDTVVRLDFAGAFSVYSGEENEILDSYGANLTEFAKVKTTGEIFTYNFSEPVKIDTLLVLNSTAILEVSSDGENFSPLNLSFAEEKLSKRSCYISKTSFTAKAIRSNIGNILGAFSKETVITIKPDEIINTDFIAAGTNVLPFQLMPESTEKYGYAESFIELEHKAIRELRPKLIRVWFQNDWFQTAPDEYDFTQPKMQQFLKYMDVFRELGTEIELNFSFVVGSKLHSWFTIPEVKDQGRSAPRDTKQFGRSVAVCLKYLTDELGYNIKYLTVSNEPQNGNFAVTNEPDEDRAIKKAYYAQTLKDIDEALRNAGIRDRFEIWGPEDCSYMNHMDWLADMYRLADDVIDRYTKHSYVAYNDELLNDKIPFYFKSTNGGRVCLTEFGFHLPTFEQSTVGAIISSANGGLDAALHWALCNSVLTDPFNSPYDEDLCLYRNDGFKNEGLYIESICGEYGPAMRYVPAHSRVIKTVCSNSHDARAAVFEKDGDYTIVAETNCSGQRDLVINVGEFTHKPFYKISYNIGERKRPTEIMPELTPVEIKDGVIREKLSNDHCMYLYTTLK